MILPRRFSKIPPAMMNLLKEVPHAEVDGGAMRRAVLGRLPDKFCGRDVVLVRRMPGMFGSPCVQRPTLSLHTLHKGIVNQMEITAGPSAYWAVLDSASELGRGFTDEQVIGMAVRLLKGSGSRKPEKELKRACNAAWATTKWHQNHPWKKTRGFGYMVDVFSEGGMAIRGRHADETMKYFEHAAKRKMSGIHVKRDRKVQMPTEKCPVAVVIKPTPRKKA
jgi:hypothetical protein